MSIDLDEIRSRSMRTRDGFYHVVGNYRCMKEADFEALMAEVEYLRKERPAVVEWLRQEDYPCCRDCNGQLADWIERGDHRRGEEK